MPHPCLGRDSDKKPDDHFTQWSDCELPRNERPFRSHLQLRDQGAGKTRVRTRVYGTLPSLQSTNVRCFRLICSLEYTDDQCKQSYKKQYRFEVIKYLVICNY